MIETEKAWLAGIFDGEGCVWSRWPKRMNVVTEITMTHKPTIERINSLFPGRVAMRHLSGIGKRPQWRWSLDTNGTRRFLSILLPYLVTKRDEARIALKLCERSHGTEGFDKLQQQLRVYKSHHKSGPHSI